MNRVGRIFDWRFFVSLAAVLMVAYLVVGGYQDNVAKGHRIDRLIAAAQHQDEAVAQGNALASAERQALLANQERILRLNHRQALRLVRLERRQTRLLQYLKDQGIVVPREFNRTGNLPGRRPSKHHQAPELTKDSPVPGHSGGHANPKAEALDTTLQGITDLLDNLLKGTIP